MQRLYWPVVGITRFHHHRIANIHSHRKRDTAAVKLQVLRFGSVPRSTLARHDIQTDGYSCVPDVVPFDEVTPAFADVEQRPENNARRLSTCTCRIG